MRLKDDNAGLRLPSRREFLTAAGAVGISTVMPAIAPKRLRVAVVGTGDRGIEGWCRPLIARYSDVVEIVGLCDLNRKRVEAARQYLGAPVAAVPVFVDFDEMVKTTRADSVLVTTPDATHWRYIVRGMELGCHVFSEKAMCTDEQQCRAILEGQKRTGGKITIAHNARHEPGPRKIRQLLMEKSIGEVLSVVYHEYLSTGHGASYFRRWHRLKEMNGTLLVTKGCHHFDNVNWWLQARPTEVTATGKLAFYGRNNSFRSSHCRVCPHQNQCSFYWDIHKDEIAMKLFAECESEDGYLRDGCVWREDADIYDTSSLRVKYDNGVTLTHTLEAFLPYEGEWITFNGSKGRLDFMNYQGGDFQRQELRVTRLFKKSEVVDFGSLFGAATEQSGDNSLRNLLFRNQPADDPLKLRARLEEAALAALVGIAGYRSVERGGQAVKILDLGAGV